jgi:hypothetical protein
MYIHTYIHTYTYIPTYVLYLLEERARQKLFANATGAREQFYKEGLGRNFDPRYIGRFCLGAKISKA